MLTANQPDVENSALFVNSFYYFPDYHPGQGRSKQTKEIEVLLKIEIMINQG